MLKVRSLVRDLDNSEDPKEPESWQADIQSRSRAGCGVHGEWVGKSVLDTSWGQVQDGSLQMQLSPESHAWPPTPQWARAEPGFPKTRPKRGHVIIVKYRVPDPTPLSLNLRMRPRNGSFYKTSWVTVMYGRAGRSQARGRNPKQYRAAQTT